MTALRLHRVGLALTACATLFAALIQPVHGAAPAPAAPASRAAATVSYHKVDVDGVKVFYREAGPKNAPAILLLHGFPTSSHMFRELIPKLADRYRVLAPDYPGHVSPDSAVLDQAYMDRPGNKAIQLEMFYSYGTNPPLYPGWQAYFRKHQPPMLIVWGKNDKIFPAEGATPYLRDLPKAELHLLDTGHFALEEDGEQIARLMRDFLGRTVKR